MDIVTIDANRPEDLLAVRAASRAIAAGVGIDETDSVRLATALSEIGREVVGTTGTAVVFSLEDTPAPAIVVTFVLAERGHDLRGASGVVAARRLVDEVCVQDPPAPAVRVVKTVPRRARFDGASLAAAVRAAVPPSPLEELWSQNRELASALSEVRAKQEETLRLNAELEETNKGVMAMYGQLSEELEETNRGVVALYAELDDKSVQLQEAGKAKSRFFTAVSHELRSPVNSILALTRVLSEEDADPLTAEPGNPARGKAVAVNSDMGNCVICHHMPVPELPEGAAGDIGPDLAGVGSRLTAAELRQRVVNPKAIDPDTVMPAYYVATGLTRVEAEYEGEPILTAQQVEDLIAYLQTLK